MKTDIKKNLLHDGFLAGIYIKGFDGAMEILGGFLLMMVNPERLNNMIVFLTQHELSEDTHDIIANYLLKISSSFTISSQHFGIYYLLSHGILKLFLVFMLLEKKLWAFHFAVVFLALFIGYQLYRFTYSHSLWLIAMAFFDAVVIFLIWMEHNRIINNYFNSVK
jgi:uncharacterized membrane protein